MKSLGPKFSRLNSIEGSLKRTNCLKLGFSFLAIALSLWQSVGCEKKNDLTSEEDKISYALGYKNGEAMIGKGIDLKKEIWIQGFSDAIEKKPGWLNSSELQKALYAAQQKTETERARKAHLSLEESRLWFEKQKASGEWKSHPSGILFKEIKKGSGPTPKSEQKVKMHYVGKLIDGQIFDSTYLRGQPALLTVSALVPGWREALLSMPVGSEWVLVIPSHLGFKEFANNLIPPHANLLIEVNLIEIR